LLDRKDVFVIDTETTGLGRRSEVLEVAVIDTTGCVLLDTVSLPQGPIPRDASDVHGLTRARLRTMGARSWPAVHAKLALLLEDASSVIAWNAEFDRSMLEQTAERHGLMLPAVPWRCAMQAEADTHGPDTAWSNLKEAAEYWCVPASDAHSAVDDARTTLAVVRRLAEPTGCQHPRWEDEPTARWKSGGVPRAASEPALVNEPAEKALTALTAQELREVQRQIKGFDVAARQARKLFARLESGIDANDVPCAIRELDALKQECVTLAAYLAGRGIDVNASGVIRELDALKLQLADPRNYHPRAPYAPGAD
jgi:DNA polymerase III epsilon subunit-like protein